MSNDIVNKKLDLLFELIVEQTAVIQATVTAQNMDLTGMGGDANRMRATGREHWENAVKIMDRFKGIKGIKS